METRKEDDIIEDVICCWKVVEKLVSNQEDGSIVVGESAMMTRILLFRVLVLIEMDDIIFC